MDGLKPATPREIACGLIRNIPDAAGPRHCIASSAGPKLRSVGVCT